MPILFQCEKCNRSLSVARRKANSQTECPTCRESIRIPSIDSEFAVVDKVDPRIIRIRRPLAVKRVTGSRNRARAVFAVVGSVAVLTTVGGLGLWSMWDNSEPRSKVVTEQLSTVANQIAFDTSNKSIEASLGEANHLSKIASHEVSEKDISAIADPYSSSVSVERKEYDIPTAGLTEDVEANSEPTDQASPEIIAYSAPIAEQDVSKDGLEKAIVEDGDVEKESLEKTARFERQELEALPDPPSPIELKEILAQVPSVSGDENFQKSFAKLDREATHKECDPKESLMAKYPMLAGLPWIMGIDCTIPDSQVKPLSAFANYVRRTAPYHFNVTEESGNGMLDALRLEDIQKLSNKLLGQQPITLSSENSNGITLTNNRAIAGGQITLGGFSGEKPDDLDFRSPDAVPALRQLILANDTLGSLVLLKTLSQIDSPQATEALAHSAIFHLDPKVRDFAVQALSSRNQADFRDEILRGLKYPMNAFVRNAADVVTRLQLSSFAKELDQLLEGESPTQPFPQYTTSGRIDAVREVVQIHHNSNCTLCHVRTRNHPTPPFPTLVSPTPLNKFQVVSLSDSKSRFDLLLGDAYYNRKGTQASNLSAKEKAVNPSMRNAFVFAGTTYLRPDFSVAQSIPAKVNPTVINFGQSNDSSLKNHLNRFDYLVRVRPAEPSDFSENARANSSEYFGIIQQARTKLLNDSHL